MKWIDKNLYIKPINTHIDPYKPVENAIITHGHADHAKPGHKNVLATKETIEIMKIRYGENCAENFQVAIFDDGLQEKDIVYDISFVCFNKPEKTTKYPPPKAYA